MSSLLLYKNTSFQHFTNSTLFLILPATLLVGVQTANEMDELLGDELFRHDQLQLVKVSPLLL